MRFTYCFFLLFSFALHEAKGNVDSLQNAYINSKDLLQRYEIKTELGRYYFNVGAYDSALVEFKDAVKFVPNRDKQKKAEAIVRVASTLHFSEDIQNALYYYKIAHRLYLQTNSEPATIADLLKDIGRAYYDYAQYDSAMVYYMQSKEIYESNAIFNKDYGVLFHYIGSVFKRQNNMDKACEYYQMQIDYGEKYNFKEIIAEGLYLQTLCLDNDTAMLRQDLKALQLWKELNNDRLVAMMYNNVSLGYTDIGMLDSAFYYLSLNIEYERKTGAKSMLAAGLSNLAHLLIEMDKMKDVLNYLNEAEMLAFQSDLKRYINLSIIYNEFFRYYYKKGNYKKAVDYLQLHYNYKDSSSYQSQQDAIHEMELAYETEKKEAAIALLEIDRNKEQFEKELAQAETEQQKAHTKIVMFSGIIIFILGIFVLFKWRESNKQKHIISKQKQEVEQQKELIEEKNKDITDSMIYASSIQQAIITSEEYIAGMFNDFFVFYKPRDIVSGDFYWAYQADDGKKLIAVGDCTGHGVPGAMMSMLGSAFLNEIVIEGKERNPGIVLDKMRNQIKNALSKKGGKDGMDLAFCCVDGNRLTFAGANLPIYVVRKDELIEVKGDKQPIGFQPSPETPFVTNNVELKPEDKIYLFSDGYADQFGGPKGKKYKYKTFKDKLAVIANMTFKEQRIMIDTEFETWKGDLEQLDDVCVIGVRI